GLCKMRPRKRNVIHGSVPRKWNQRSSDLMVARASNHRKAPHRRLRRRLRTKAQISYNMSRVRSSGSKIERLMERAFLRAKLRPKKHPRMFGHPDFLFPRARVVVFCDSHFWHGYKWKEKHKELERNRDFWMRK